MDKSNIPYVHEFWCFELFYFCLETLVILENYDIIM